MIKINNNLCQILELGRKKQRHKGVSFLFSDDFIRESCMIENTE